MGVYVSRGGEVGVPEDAAYHPEVLARFDHQGGERSYRWNGSRAYAGTLHGSHGSHGWCVMKRPCLTCGRVTDRTRSPNLRRRRGAVGERMTQRTPNPAIPRREKYSPNEVPCSTPSLVGGIRPRGHGRRGTGRRGFSERATNPSPATHAHIRDSRLPDRRRSSRSGSALSDHSVE
jgi:hypothetical protein